MPPEKLEGFTFCSLSGNSCRIRLEEQGPNLAVDGTWKHRPSEEDIELCNQFVLKRLEESGIEAEDAIYAVHGGGTGAKARSTEAVRRFLKTGDPGVSTKKTNAPVTGK